MIKKRMEKLLAILSEGLYEKAEIIRLALLASIAGESIFLLGPPGVAKSLIARRLKHAYLDAVSFEYLMGRFSTPDEIFGPISIKSLRDEDKYERIVSNYLPDADIVFLDEIWKASPAIQNSLLTALNEKLFRNGQQEIHLKIKGIIAASNELPEEDEGLEALWDRFIIRLLLQNIQDSDAFNCMITESDDLYRDKVPQELKISQTEYLMWSRKIDTIDVPPEVIHLIQVIRKKIALKNFDREEAGEKPIFISDRRWKKIVRLLRTAAFLNDRKSIDIMDCYLISYCIWSHNEAEIDEMSHLVIDSIENHAYQQGLDLKSIQVEVSELQKEVEEEITEMVDVLLNLPKRYNNGLYKILGFSDDVQSANGDLHAFIEGEIYDALQKTPRKTALYFGIYGSAMKYKKVYPIRKEAESAIGINGEVYAIETEWRTKKKIQPRNPSKKQKAQWNRRIGELDTFCNRRLNRIAEYMKKGEEHATSNLFVDTRLSDLLFANLQQNSQQIDCLKLEINKIQNSYDSPVASSAFNP